MKKGGVEELIKLLVTFTKTTKIFNFQLSIFNYYHE